MKRVPFSQLAALACSLAGVVGCEQEPKKLPPFGEVRLAIDTDLAVPSWVGRVRIDLFDGQGTWIDTRDFATFEPTDFPLTFSLFTLDEATARDAFVRVRLYPETDLRPYRGERFSARPAPPENAPVTATMDEVCGSAPELPLSTRLRLTAPRSPQTGEGAGFTCGKICGETDAITGSGLAAATITIETAGRYVIEALPPSGVQLDFASRDPMLTLRRSCADGASQVACNDNADGESKCQDRGSGSLAYAPRIVADLAPGTYVGLVGNRFATPLTVDLSVRPEGTELPADFEGLDPGTIGGGPRLVQNGVDITPELEPAPAVTVDRLVAVHVDPGVVRTAQVLLTGECLGTMVDLAGRRSCVDRENELSALTPLALTEGRTRGETRVGKWAALSPTPCATVATAGDPALRDGRTCVEGGAFVLGDLGAIELGDLGATPRRPAVVTPFLLDTYEVTIARYRAALARGFLPPDLPGLTEFELTSDSDCPFSLLAPHPERDGFAMACITWYTARSFCQFEGGDLPTTVQREFAAVAAGRAAKTRFPWGDAEPTCETTAYGRATDGTVGVPFCNQLGRGAVSVDAEPWAGNDRTPAGVVGLGGNIREWLRDAHRSYDDVCWRSTPLRDPACLSEESTFFGIAGSSWRRGVKEARGANRQREAPVTSFSSDVGFRCVYAGAPGTSP